MTWNNFKRIMPVIDIVIFGVLILIMDVIVSAVLIVQQDSPPSKTLMRIIAVLILNAIFVWKFIWRWMQRPTFITKHGVGVWANGIEEVTPKLVEAALDFYISHMVKLSDEKYFITVFTRGDLGRMLNGASIEFTKTPVTVLWPGLWKVRDRELQDGKAMLVQWGGSISNSALFHGLHHMIDELVLGRPNDYEHADPIWWMSVIKLNTEFGR